MTNKIQINLAIRYEIAALIQTVIEQTGLTIEEILNRALFCYYPELFLKSNIKQVKTWIFFDKREQLILNKILKWYGISEENLFYQLFGLTDEEKTI
jgi:hypothetical protein